MTVGCGDVTASPARAGDGRKLRSRGEGYGEGGGSKAEREMESAERRRETDSRAIICYNMADKVELPG